MYYHPYNSQQPIIDTQEFLALSSFFNYQLSGEPVNWHGILDLMLHRPLEEAAATALENTLEFLGRAYRGQKRRLGPLAVLHPIRATALLAKAWPTAPLEVLLLALLHDKDEDIHPGDYPPAQWQEMNKLLETAMAAIGPQRAAVVERGLVGLTKARGEKYHAYLGNLFGLARDLPDLAAVKLADRLDNTLDLRVDLHDFTDHSRCYQILFDILFLKSYRGFTSPSSHPIARKINGAMRLYQLYKNAVFLSLLRREGPVLTEAAGRLAASLAVASIREAQTILLHIFAYHLPDAEEQRRLLEDVIAYSHAGGFNRISDAGDHPLDGLFRRYFVFQGKQEKRQGLDALYQDKKLMGRAALGFIVIFANFLNDPEYYIDGISSSGIRPLAGAS